MAMSPRISFSHDFVHNEPIPVEQRPNNSRSPIDFDFCIRECPAQESSSADEIFSHGRILPLPLPLPLQIKTKSDEPPSNPSPPLTRVDAKPRLKKKSDPEKQGAALPNSKSSFWHFKRSTSCGSAYTRSLCPLPLLSRSNSTGSTPKRTPLPKDGVPQKKQSPLRNNNNNNNNNNSQIPFHKPPLKKLHANNLHGLQVNPILNLHSANLFGLASIFSSSPKDRTNKRRSQSGGGIIIQGTCKINDRVGVSSVFVFWLGRNIHDCGSIIGIFFISYLLLYFR